MITFDPDKRATNLLKHGIDLVIAEQVLMGYTITREDARDAYGETRLQTLGVAGDMVVCLVHTPREESDHIISARKAQRHEERYYWENFFRYNG